MTFLEPVRLVLLLGAAALLVAYVVVQLRRGPAAVRFTNLDLLATVAPTRPGWRRHLAAGAFLLALVVLVAGYAQPARDEQVPRERATVVMAIDTSLSMDATDVAPSRLKAAQAAAKSFLDTLPPTINVGLVTFNGTATVKVAPTTDRDAVRVALDQLKLGESTAIGEAIFTSLDALDQLPPDAEGTTPPARIVLMSDGTNTVGRSPQQGVDAANAAGVPVSTIAFGTDTGTIPNPQGPGVAYVPVDRASLQAIAELTDGTFYAAASQQQLTEVYANIGSSIGYVTELRDISSWFLATGLVVLVGAAGLSLVWTNRLP